MKAIILFILLIIAVKTINMAYNFIYDVHAEAGASEKVLNRIYIEFTALDIVTRVACVTAIIFTLFS